MDCRWAAARPLHLEPRSEDHEQVSEADFNEEGATAIEYGLIAALIAVAAIGAMTSIGNSLNNTFNNVSNHLG